VQAYPGVDLDIDSMVAHCRRELTKTKVPEAITLFDELPKNPVGKPDKPALRRIAEEAAAASVGDSSHIGR
jgi:acyl-coenzyme A synthetase/AMP-(fatty) acid ligase